MLLLCDVGQALSALMSSLVKVGPVTGPLGSVGRDLLFNYTAHIQ